MENQFVFILHNIRSRFNVGSVFRTADGCGVDKIYLGGITPAPPHQRISKVALGAEEFVPWEHHKQTWRLIDKLKKQGCQIIAVEQSNKSIAYNKFKPKWPTAFVFGSETKGLSPQILKRCDKAVEIPMHGQKESLNVSVSAGIIGFEMNKCR
ncbi:RNA methyltransferase [Patescibacteria group bacterium]|nr:RNA methyltransferase [Patescibacteria group bacterium]MBU1672939.1 RNA methyltransferase [Patescibacteria group bacterium]MBU1963581.1 RNA methyltransferase [Patescibacteria group bacterium]MBU1963586.1 RNA methyltransferase [Patescibacteria group bacterium]